MPWRVAFNSALIIGLLDRLIADDYRRADLIALTRGRKLAALPKARRL